MKNLSQYLWQPLHKLLKYSLIIIPIYSMQGKVATIYSLKDLEEKSQHNPYIVLFAYKKEDFTKKVHIKANAFSQRAQEIINNNGGKAEVV